MARLIYSGNKQAPTPATTRRLCSGTSTPSSPGQTKVLYRSDAVSTVSGSTHSIYEGSRENPETGDTTLLYSSLQSSNTSSSDTQDWNWQINQAFGLLLALVLSLLGFVLVIITAPFVLLANLIQYLKNTDFTVPHISLPQLTFPRIRIALPQVSIPWDIVRRWVIVLLILGVVGSVLYLGGQYGSTMIAMLPKQESTATKTPVIETEGPTGIPTIDRSNFPTPLTSLEQYETSSDELGATSTASQEIIATSLPAIIPSETPTPDREATQYIEGIIAAHTQVAESNEPISSTPTVIVSSPIPQLTQSSIAEVPQSPLPPTIAPAPSTDGPSIVASDAGGCPRDVLWVVSGFPPNVELWFLDERITSNCNGAGIFHEKFLISTGLRTDESGKAVFTKFYGVSGHFRITVNDDFGNSASYSWATSPNPIHQQSREFASCQRTAEWYDNTEFPATITFKNTTVRTLHVYWVDFQGDVASPPRVMNPGEQYVQDTWHGYSWCVLDASTNEVMATVVASSNPAMDLGTTIVEVAD